MHHLRSYSICVIVAAEKKNNKTAAVSLAHPSVPFHIAGLTPPFDLESGATNTQTQDKHMLSDRMRLYHTGKHFSGGKLKKCLVSCTLFIKPTGKVNGEIWGFFGDVILFLAGPVWEFSSCFLDTSSDQRVFFFVWCPRTIFWLV